MFPQNIERGLGTYLFESKKASEDLRPKVEIRGYDSKELQEIMRYSENQEI